MNESTDKPASRVAVITGASRGMGLEAARQLLQRGHTVVLTARRLEQAQAAADTLQASGRVFPFALDVLDGTSPARLAAYLHEQHGGVGILVNNAGAFFEPTDQASMMNTSVFDLQPDTLRQTLETNTLGALTVSQALIPLMREAGYGRVVNVSSSMGSLATLDRGWPAYRLSKLALNGVTRLFAAELKGSNVKVNSVCPGWVRTQMGGPYAAKSVEEGVDTTIWLATLPDDGPSGGFFQERRPIPW